MVLRVSARAGRVSWPDASAVVGGGALVAGALDAGAVVAGGGAAAFVGSIPHPVVASASTVVRA
ncbi:hypothetical protein ACWEPC_57365, partial [Nonomuraea sp. NPDC004297]